MTINGVSVVDFAAVLLATGLLRAVPLVVAGIGEAVAERAGLLNLGIEGMMLSGCFFGFWAAYETDSLLIGMLAAVGAGLVLALLFGWLAITLKIDQILIGLAITIAGSGLTGYLFRDQFGGRNVAVDVNTSKIHVPWLKEIPVIGPALFEQQPLFYVSWALVPIVAWVLFRTRFGLQVRGAGEAPVAVDAAGVIGRAGAVCGDRDRRGAGRLRGRIPVRGRCRHLHDQHDRRPGLHRAGAGDGRQLEPVADRGRGDRLRPAALDGRRVADPWCQHPPGVPGDAALPRRDPRHGPPRRPHTPPFRSSHAIPPGSAVTAEVM